jgi:hypothetical protein
MTYENKTGLNVYSQYGARNSGGVAGVDCDYDELLLEFTGESVNNGFLPPVVIPVGTLFRRAYLRVNEAFNITGTTPTVIFGGTAPATNGIVLTEAELENVGTKVPASTGTGTWSFSSTTGTTSAERVKVTTGGTSPVVDATVGRAVLVIEYAYETK